MRRPALLLTCLLAVTTALGLLLTGISLSPPARGTASPATPRDADEANLALVRDLYSAMNATLQTGDAAPLAALLAADFADRLAVPGSDATAAGLIRYLLDLRASYTTAWLTVEDLQARGDWVLTRVRLDGTAHGTLLGIPVTGRPAAWSAVEMYRIAADRIAERWCACRWPALPQNFGQATLVAPPEAALVRLARLTLASGAFKLQGSSAGPLLLTVESGSLTVESEVPAMLIRAEADRGNGSPPSSWSAVGLQPGDGLLLSPGIRHAFRNDGDAPAVVLALALLSWGGDAREGATFSWPIAAPPAVIADVLIDGAITRLPEEAATITLGRLTLALGVDLAPRAATGPQLVFVESGLLQVVAPVEHARLISAGTGAFLPLDHLETLRAAGDEPVVGLVVTIVAATSAPPAVSTRAGGAAA